MTHLTPLTVITDWLVFKKNKRIQKIQNSVIIIRDWLAFLAIEFESLFFLNLFKSQNHKIADRNVFFG